jgi:hypothetical protein
MLLKIIVDGQVYYPALADNAKSEEIQMFVRQCADGEFEHFQFKTPSKEIITLGCEVLKRAVYIITE